MKDRKIIVSITVDPKLVAEVIKLDDEQNFSRYTSKALIFYNEHIAKQKNK